MEKIDQLLGMVAELQREVRDLRTSLAQRVNAPKDEPIGKEILSVDEFVAELGKAGLRRSKYWLYDQIRLRRVRPLRLGRPWQIPRSELLRITKGGE